MNTLSDTTVIKSSYQSHSLLLKNNASKLEQLAVTAPWKKLKELLHGSSKAIGKPFHHPILIMKLLVLQELLDIDTEQLREHLDDRYSLFVFLIPGMENGIPEQSEVDRLKNCLQEMNLLYPFLSECVETLGLDRSKINLYEYYGHETSAEYSSTSCALHSLACPRCGRKNLHIRTQSLITKIFSRRKAYTCNVCTLHFAL
ncbi:MAG: hypothetical protein KAG20_08955 [Cocleimonas sp.]|nr:hypothetical protein [Cocleimonas sp.]